MVIAEYDDYKNSIFINKNITKKNLIICSIFHELGHKHCCDNSLFVSYHTGKDKRLEKLTALKAERFVDKWAAKEMKKQGYKIKYPFFYSEKGRAKNLKIYMDKFVEEF